MKILFAALLLTGLFTFGCYQAPHPRIECTHVCCHDELHSLPASGFVKNEASIRLPEQVKAYAVNRYIDPANPKIMHERHVIYRVEKDPNWRLFSDENRQILIGNTLTNGRLNYNPALMEKELALELQRQRLNNEMLLNQSDTLIETGIHLSTNSQILDARSEQMKKIIDEQRIIIDKLELKK